MCGLRLGRALPSWDDLQHQELQSGLFQHGLAKQPFAHYESWVGREADLLGGLHLQRKELSEALTEPVKRLETISFNLTAGVTAIIFWATRHHICNVAKADLVIPSNCFFEVFFTPADYCKAISVDECFYYIDVGAHHSTDTEYLFV